MWIVMDGRVPTSSGLETRKIDMQDLISAGRLQTSWQKVTHASDGHCRHLRMFVCQVIGEIERRLGTALGFQETLDA